MIINIRDVVEYIMQKASMSYVVIIQQQQIVVMNMKLRILMEALMLYQTHLVKEALLANAEIFGPVTINFKSVL